MVNQTPVTINRTALEDIIAHLISAENDLRVASTRLVQQARTEVDAMNIADVTRARVDISIAKRELSRQHPNHQERGTP